MIKRTLLACALLLSLGDSDAQTIGFHTVSAHFGGRGMNNQNPGVYMKTQAGWTAGFFINSYERTSIYAGRSWDKDFANGWQASITLGGVTGYPSYAVLPLVAPSIATPEQDGWRLRMTAAPKIHQHGAAVLHLMVERDWK